MENPQVPTPSFRGPPAHHTMVGSLGTCGLTGRGWLMLQQRLHGQALLGEASPVWRWGARCGGCGGCLLLQQLQQQLLVSHLHQDRRPLRQPFPTLAWDPHGLAPLGDTHLLAPEQTLLLLLLLLPPLALLLLPLRPELHLPALLELPTGWTHAQAPGPASPHPSTLHFPLTHFELQLELFQNRTLSRRVNWYVPKTGLTACRSRGSYEWGSLRTPTPGLGTLT